VLLTYALTFLCWGSFLNVVAFRLVRDEPLTGRSRCPHCTATLSWYDLIPVLSWLMLRGKCRSCSQSICPLYPLIELVTAILMCALVYLIPGYFASYFVLFSALIINTRSDLDTMLISRATTLWLIPVALACAAAGLLPINLLESAAGSLFGFAVLYSVSWLFKRATDQEGLGQGDIDLIAMIGAFTGIAGAWWSLTIASILGSAIGIAYLATTGQGRMTRIPFGPFLAAGCIIYTLFGQLLM